MKRGNPKKGCNNRPRAPSGKGPVCYGCCRVLVLYGPGWLEGLCADCADVMKGIIK